MPVCKKCGTTYEGSQCPVCAAPDKRDPSQAAADEKKEYRRQRWLMIGILAAMLIFSGLLSLWVVHVVT